MLTGQTIVAQASAPGASLRMVIRLSGERARDALDSLGISVPQGRGAVTTALRWNEHRTLPCILLWMPAPHSYTTEDCAEIQLPGSQVIARRVLDRLTTLDDVRLAEAGEFSVRAYLHGRISIEQAEGIAWTIAARNDAELAASRAVLNGMAGEHSRQLADTLAQCLALVEAGIDFTDQEDVVAITPADLHRQLSHIAKALAQRLSDAGARAHAPSMPRAALVGAPSSGKSTLFNALLGRHRAVVHEDEGTTRDVLREPLALDDILPAWQVELQDLPGLDARAHDDASRAAQQAARAALAQADVLIWCDPTARFDESLIDAGSARVVRVRTKADLPGADDESTSYPVCALDGWGLDATRRAISDAAWSCAHTHASAAQLLMPRHEQAIRNTLDAIRDALVIISPDQQSLAESELVAERLRAALDGLGTIVGHIDPDEIVGRVFASFCVGK